jgi:murein DD-endopeptidase MepM/ murein hydrolase activator NlpD
MKTFASATSSLSKIKPRLALLIIVLLLALPAPAAFAQQEAQGVRYIVQAGDTLSSIALRFDVPIQDIITASGIADPNNLHVGDVLIIPGIDWIDGTLLIQDIPLGESYLSIKRRYLLTDENMARLNQLTSPEQLYAGFPALLATERGELTDSGRVAVGPGQSLLEIAAASGDNPWRLAAVNQLPGTWAALPGDVLFTPAKTSAGPGGLPSVISSVEVDDPGFVQGKTLVINIATNSDVALGGDFFGHPLHFFPTGDNQQVALQGVPLQAELGPYDFTLSGTLPDGAAFNFTQPVRVQSGGYDSESITVDLQFLDPTENELELENEIQLMAPAGPTKLWSGFWGPPHPYTNVINSEFGIHRTYNKGVYTSYHFGTDFGGGVGMEIFAPAPGKVIFAGMTVIHGNFTVIDHGWGVYTTYSHQSEIRVQVGDEVQTGQVIGLVGKTGRVTGAHLHWEVWVGDVPVEPMDWLARAYP